MTMRKNLLTTLLVLAAQGLVAQRPQTPVMGWASWNNYRVNINEHIIRAQADKLVKLGLDDVGYTYLNIDDGFFGGRDADGNLIAHPGKFPEGMQAFIPMQE
jgi:alpha-galactosidase